MKTNDKERRDGVWEDEMDNDDEDEQRWRALTERRRDRFCRAERRVELKEEKGRKEKGRDLFFGGTETTANTSEWVMAELLRNPEKMKTAREELHTTIGKQNMATKTDITNLPYMQAIVKESLRLHPPIPLVSRKNTDSDLGLSGFTVPKNSRVWINIYGIGRDPKVWPDLEEFKPERFLGPGRLDVMGRDFEVIPFGSGRRICVGMSLALRMAPLSLASLINSFDWKVDNVATMDMEEKFGLTMQKAVPLRALPIFL